MHCSEKSLKTLVQLPEDMRECWEWNGTVNAKTGYGKKRFNGKDILAHRWVYELLLGPIPQNLVVNHLCGNRSCVNPRHLEVCSQAENCRKGNGAKLTRLDVEEIKAMKQKKKWGLGKKIADKYGVSSALIHDIWNDRAWSDVSDQ